MNRKKLLTYIAAGLIFSIAGCKSSIYDPEENGANELSVLAVTRSALIDGKESINEDEAEFEDRVHNLAMLAFDSSNGKPAATHFESVPLSEKSKTVLIRVSPGQRDFYFVANMPVAELEAISNSTEMESYMQKLANLDTDLYLNASETKGFPMARVYKNQTVTPGGTESSPALFRPDGEDEVKLIRVVAKLEVHISGDATAQVKNIYFHNARRQFSLASLTTPEADPVYHNAQALKKTGNNTYIYYMPEALMTSAQWVSSGNKLINYFVIETAMGTTYEVPIITYDGIIPGDAADYLTFAKGELPEKPDYQIYRNHRYVYTIKKLEGIEIYYDINPWEMRQSAFYMGYGYNVGVDENGKITISNTVEACDPHKVTLKTISPFAFSDNTTEKTFDNIDPSASGDYALKTVPAAGDSYLEVWYNDVLVKTFTK